MSSVSNDCRLYEQIQSTDMFSFFFHQLATKITTFFIEHFGMRDLLGRENYEYYARLTGRILKVEDEWIFFTYPPVIFGGSGAGDAPNDEPR